MAPAKHLLFVDDEDSIRLTLVPILTKHGFEVTAVAGVADALVQMDLTKYDVLISDLNIEKPGDGFAVVAGMKVRQPTCTNIILTAYPDFDSAQQAIRLNVADYFVKPVNVEELISKIAKAGSHESQESRDQLESIRRKEAKDGKRSQGSRYRARRTSPR
jgi:two-component system response regulator YesN